MFLIQLLDLYLYTLNLIFKGHCPDIFNTWVPVLKSYRYCIFFLTKRNR